MKPWHSCTMVDMMASSMLDHEPLPNSPFNSTCGHCKSPGLCKKKARCLHGAANMFSGNFQETLIELTEQMRMVRRSLTNRFSAGKDAIRSRRAAQHSTRNAKADQINIIREAHFDNLPPGPQKAIIKQIRKGGYNEATATKIARNAKNVLQLKSHFAPRKIPKRPPGQ